MIQRIQTVYIILGTLLVLVAGFLIPHARHLTTNISGQFVNNNLFLNMTYVGLIFLILFFINSSIAIIKFNNRKKQIYHINFNLITILILLLTIYIFDFFIFNKRATDIIGNPIDYTHNWLFDISIMLGFFCFLLAKKSIKKDEDLINSINRLR